METKTVLSILKTRLVTENRSRVSICDRPCKIVLKPSLIAIKNLVVVSHTVCAHVKGPKNFWDAGLSSRWIWRG